MFEQAPLKGANGSFPFAAFRGRASSYIRWNQVSTYCAMSCPWSAQDLTERCSWMSHLAMFVLEKYYLEACWDPMWRSQRLEKPTVLHVWKAWVKLAFEASHRANVRTVCILLVLSLQPSSQSCQPKKQHQRRVVKAIDGSR